MTRTIVTSLALVHFLVCTTALPSKAGEPLFLTPLIENGELDVARQKAKVEHDEMKDVESYSGYLTINKTYNSNTFFWYFPSESDPSNDPLLIWMTGGPGTTSLFALFSENGPFIVNENRTLEMRKYSWHRNHNIIFIDNPIGTGFSFTEDEKGYARKQTDIGRDVLAALLQFFQLFPEMRKNDFYVTGESYAGKYVPAVSHAIMMYNNEAETKINFVGLAYGNGITDPINQMNRSDFLYDIGLLDVHGRKHLADIEAKIRAMIKEEKYVEAIELFNAIFPKADVETPSVFTNLTGYAYHYNYLLDKQPEELYYFVEWVERTDIRKALHVGNSTFIKANPKIREYLKGDLIQSVAHFLVDLLPHYKVLIYSGMLDVAVPYVTTENFLKHLDWPGNAEYQKTMRKQWWVGDELAGYSKIVKNLHEVVVRNAGHLVPTDQSYWAWDLITRFTRDFPM